MAQGCIAFFASIRTMKHFDRSGAVAVAAKYFNTYTFVVKRATKAYDTYDLRSLNNIPSNHIVLWVIVNKRNICKTYWIKHNLHED